MGQESGYSLVGSPASGTHKAVLKIQGRAEVSSRAQ